MMNSYNFISTYADFANHIFKKINTQLETIFIQKKLINFYCCARLSAKDTAVKRIQEKVA